MRRAVLPGEWRRRAPAVRPAVGVVRVNGTPIRVRHWTAEEWAGTPGRDRPAATFADDRGGFFAADPA